MLRLYVCRHGESKLNALETYAGQTDTPLTELGRDEARQAGENAKMLNLSCIVASPLSRALETAQIIAKEIDYPLDQVLVEKVFMERALGSLEGKPFATYPDPAIYTDIEPEQSLLDRAQAGLTYLQALESDNVLLVAHGTFLRALHSLLDANAPSVELPNAKIVQLI